MFHETLQKVVDNCQGAAAAVVMGVDGIAIESFTKNEAINIKTIGAEFSFVLTQIRDAADILKIGALEEICVRSEDLTFLIRTLSNEYFFGLALLPEGNFGQARFLMRMALPELHAQL